MAKTLQERLEAAEANVEKIKGLIAAEKALDVTEVGDTVSVTFGRGDKKRTLEGVVRFIKADDKGTKFASVEVAGDDGFPESYKVRVADIVSNASADARAAQDAEGDENPLDAE